MFQLIDTHSHIYLPEFNEDRKSTVLRAIDAGVDKIYLPNVDSETINALHELADEFPENCIPMMGLHPCSVKPETYNSELLIVERHLKERNYVAVGEIGLDLYWDKSTLAIQVKALQTQCEWALELSLPVVIHSRSSTLETIEVIEPFAHKGLKGVFHCFSGTAEEAQRIVAMDFMLGIGGVITYKKSDLYLTIADVPNEYLVLETDAPYLSPVPFRGKRNEPSYIQYVLTTLAEYRNVNKEQLAEITTQNAKNLFSKK
jgi:TatD DNase family protein